jgi:hypothetical protein
MSEQEGEITASVAEDGESIRQGWRDLYEHLRASHRNQSGLLSQIMVAVAGGGLGWSFTVYSQIAGPYPKFQWLIVLSWITLVSSVMAIVVSLRLSVEAFGVAVDTQPFKLETPKSNPWILKLNRVAAGCSILGLLTLGLFCGINANRKGSEIK